jgi:lipoprotein signal peptidase
MGLIFAGGISNEGEIALLNHATDFLYVKFSIFAYHRFFIANLADAMIAIGFILVVVTPTYQKIIAATEATERLDTSSQ